MNQHVAAIPEPHLLPAQLSENLRHINRKLIERGFVLRKRRVYIIEAVDRWSVRYSRRP